MIKNMAIIRLFYLCCLAITVSNTADEEKTKEQIKDYICDLRYDRHSLLTSKGENIKSVPKKEGFLDAQKDFTVITCEIKSISIVKADIGILASNEHKTYPGSLILANNRLLDNSPDTIAIKRSPLRYTINLPGLGIDGSFRINPSFANYQANLNRVIHLWFERYPEYRLNTVFQSDMSMAYSKEQLRVKFGREFKCTTVELNIDFDSVQKNKKLIAIHRFKQIFYTVSVETPEEPAALFGCNVTHKMLSRKTDSKNPPLLIDSVSYGRVIYLKIETSSTSDHAKLLLETKLRLIDLNNKNDFRFHEELENLNMEVYVMGGGLKHLELINARTLEEVNKIIIKNSKFDKKNLGYPLSYSSIFVKDNSIAILRSSTDYTVTHREVKKKGIIEISQTGWFVGQWVVMWDEIEYKNGKKESTRYGWRGNGDDRLSPYRKEIQLYGNCENIYVQAKECTFLLWEWWRIVIDESGIPLIPHRKFSMFGTTLNPKYDIISSYI